jgi:hypothetical protein
MGVSILNSNGRGQYCLGKPDGNPTCRSVLLCTATINCHLTCLPRLVPPERGPGSTGYSGVYVRSFFSGLVVAPHIARLLQRDDTHALMEAHKLHWIVHVRNHIFLGRNRHIASFPTLNKNFRTNKKIIRRILAFIYDMDH